MTACQIRGLLKTCLETLPSAAAGRHGAIHYSARSSVAPETLILAQVRLTNAPTKSEWSRFTKKKKIINFLTWQLRHVFLGSFRYFRIPAPSELRVTVSSAESSFGVSKNMLQAPKALPSQLGTHWKEALCSASQQFLMGCNEVGRRKASKQRGFMQDSFSPVLGIEPRTFRVLD